MKQMKLYWTDAIFKDHYAGHVDWFAQQYGRFGYHDFDIYIALLRKFLNLSFINHLFHMVFISFELHKPWEESKVQIIPFILKLNFKNRWSSENLGELTKVISFSIY